MDAITARTSNFGMARRISMKTACALAGALLGLNTLNGRLLAGDAVPATPSPTENENRHWFRFQPVRDEFQDTILDSLYDPESVFSLAEDRKPVPIAAALVGKVGYRFIVTAMDDAARPPCATSWRTMRMADGCLGSRGSLGFSFRRVRYSKDLWRYGGRFDHR